MQSKQLSRADIKVLAQVFDPESAPTKVEVFIDPNLPADQHISDQELLERLRGREKSAIKIIEDFEASKGVVGSRDKVYRSALSILDSLIVEYPNYASARNNRAQLRRWMYGDRNTICQKRQHISTERSVEGLAAVQDLRLVIELASPRNPQEGVSPVQGRLLAQSYTQLAALYYGAFKDMEMVEVVEVANLGGVTWNRDRFEEEASRCFYLGGLYGNEVAKALAVHTNPHAKLCGAIVKEAMRKEIAGVCS